MNLIFDLDDTLYNLMGPFELVHKKLYADKTDADCTQLFMQSRVYSDEIMEAEKKGLIPHEDCFYERVKRTYHDVGIEMSREDADIFEQLYRSFQKKITLGNRVEGFLDYCKSNDIFIAILTNGRPEPKYAKVVGDTYEADVVGANTAGWHTIWFNHRNRECPEKNRADITVKSIEELKEVIRGQIG